MTNTRQQHGFQFEEYIIHKHKLTKSSGYTNKYDAYYNKIPVQIKCIKYGSVIELGDYYRNKSKTEDFFLIIGFWKNTTDNIIKTDILFIEHSIYINNMVYHSDTAFKVGMDLITNLHVDDDAWKHFCNLHKNNYPKSNLISIRFKRDHKKQKRVQCAISNKNYKLFIQLFKHTTLIKK